MSEPTDEDREAARERFPVTIGHNEHWRALQIGRQADYAEGRANGRTTERERAKNAESEIERLREALRQVLAVSADREAFVRDGPRGFLRAEHIARDALSNTGATE